MVFSNCYKDDVLQGKVKPLVSERWLEVIARKRIILGEFYVHHQRR